MTLQISSEVDLEIGLSCSALIMHTIYMINTFLPAILCYIFLVQHTSGQGMQHREQGKHKTLQSVHGDQANDG